MHPLRILCHRKCSWPHLRSSRSVRCTRQRALVKAAMLVTIPPLGFCLALPVLPGQTGRTVPSSPCSRSLYSPLPRFHRLSRLHQLRRFHPPLLVSPPVVSCASCHA